MVKTIPEKKQEVYKAFENEENVTVLDKQYLTSKFVEIINADFISIALMTSLLVFIVLLDYVWTNRTNAGFLYSHVHQLDLDIGHYGHGGHTVQYHQHHYIGT